MKSVLLHFFQITTVIVMITLALSFFSHGIARDEDSGTDAFVLAVQYFDPGHARGLRKGCKEYSLMKDALQAARNLLPIFDEIHVSYGRTSSKHFKLDMLHALHINMDDSREVQ